jgi:trans-aconitate methyltransferase
MIMSRSVRVLPLALFDADESAKGKRFAIDLGCGSGSDTVELLRRGRNNCFWSEEALARILIGCQKALTPIDRED